jgi:hypothetical protein
MMEWQCHPQNSVAQPRGWGWGLMSKPKRAVCCYICSALLAAALGCDLA